MHVDSLWRYPIKSHGREAVASAQLEADGTFPGDRIWAVAHEASDADGSDWVSCRNFTRVAKAPGLAAVTVETHPADGTFLMRHPDLPDLRYDPRNDPQALIEWSRPLVPQNRAVSARVIAAPSRGYTDTEFPSITIGSKASHAAVEERLGRTLSLHRWRCNIWLEGLEAWDEFNWIGKPLRIGDAELMVWARTERCLATHANPETGERDADILKTLQSFGHRDFTVQATVRKSGLIRSGDAVELL